MATVGGVRIKWDRAAIAALKEEPEMLDYLREAAEGLAQAIRTVTPRLTGAGAASIAPRPPARARGALDVGWDKAHYYLSFQNNFSTLASHVNPNFHFAQEALERYSHI